MLIAYNALTIKKPYTGIQLLVMQQIKELLLRDKNNTYIVFARKNSNLFNISNSKVKIIRFTIPGAFYRVFIEQLIIPILLVRHKVSIYYSTSFVLPLIMFFSKITLFVNVYDLFPFTVPSTMTKLRALYFNILMPITLKLANVIVTISESAKNDMIKLFKINPSKIIVAHPALFPKNLGSHVNSDEAAFLPDKYLLSIGRLEKRKNFLNLAKAYRIYLSKALDPLPLVISGFKDFGGEEIVKFINENNLGKNIFLIGHAPDIDYLFKKAVIFIFPSLYEGFGLPILEAFSNNIPVITSNTSSMPEVAGRAALYVDPLKPEDIANKIEILLSNQTLQKELVNEGKNRLSFFTWDMHACIILNELNKYNVEGTT